MEIGFILLFTLFLEHLFLYLNSSRTFYFSYASLSTAVGLIVLLYSTSLWIYFVLISLALLQKHFLNFNNKHLFNPSNFALIMSLLLFREDAHIITGQFGEETLFAMVVFILALSILVRVKRWLIPLSFLFFYLSLQYLFFISIDRLIFFEEIYHRFYSVSFMLFIYFMLTDPIVTPIKYKRQILFAFSIALLATLLDYFYAFRVQHLFMSVFFVSFFVNLRPFIYDERKKMMLAMLILFLVIITLIYIEYQVPYYFEMNG